MFPFRPTCRSLKATKQGRGDCPIDDDRLRVSGFGDQSRDHDAAISWVRRQMSSRAHAPGSSEHYLWRLIRHSRIANGSKPLRAACSVSVAVRAERRVLSVLGRGTSLEPREL